MKGRVVEIARGGEALVNTEQGKVFVRGGWLGDTVELGPIERKGGAPRAKLLRVLEASADRVVPTCSVHEACGGCAFIHVSGPAQLDIKRAFVEKAAGIPVFVHESPTLRGYRRRVRFHYSGSRIGYHGAQSHRLVEPSTCEVLHASLNHALSILRERIGPLLQERGDLHLAFGVEQRPVFWILASAPQKTALYTEVDRLISEGLFSGAAFRVANAGSSATWGDPRECQIGFDALPLFSAPFGFSQANAEVNAKLVARVRDVCAGASRLLELHAGHGNFTVALASVTSQLTAMELSKEACELNRANLALRGCSNVRVLSEAARLTGHKEKFDTVVLDPPRVGAKEMMGELESVKSRKLIYVSCDTATLERDIGIAKKFGYEPRLAEAFDMFPQTAHVESLVVMERAAGRAKGAP